MLLTLQLLCCGRVRNLSGSSLLGGKPQVEHFKVRITSVSLHRLPLMTISIINTMSGKCSQLAFSVFSVNGKIKEILNETKQQIINKLFVKMFRSHAKLINWLTISALAKIGITNISCAVLMCCDHWAGRVKLRYKIFARFFQQRSFPMFDYRRVWTDQRRDPGARSSISQRMLDTWLKVEELGSLLSSTVAPWTQSDHAYCMLLVWNGHIDGLSECVRTRCSVFVTVSSSLNLSTGRQFYVVTVKMIPLTHICSFLPFFTCCISAHKQLGQLGPHHSSVTSHMCDPPAVDQSYKERTATTDRLQITRKKVV